MRTALLLLATAISAFPAGSKWNVSYQFDEDNSSLALNAIEFLSERRGIALGTLMVKGDPRPIALVTSDGGAKWEQIRLKDDPLSLTCLEEVCWMSTLKGVWRSDEGGRDWKKISGEKGILSMRFVSQTRGWAAGLEKSAWETNDGGKTWTELEVVKKIQANPATARFTSVAVNGMLGIIGGNSRPNRRMASPYPDWMEPDEAAKRREWPGMLIMLETRNGGKTWSHATNSVFGSLTAFRIRPEGTAAVALLEYFQSFETPSEVLWVDFQSGRSTSILRSKSFAVTDVQIQEGGRIVAAGTEATALRALPIPQKVQFMEGTVSAGTSSANWTTIPADYRVTARRVSISIAPGGKLWAVTDTGYILRLDRGTTVP